MAIATNRQENEAKQGRQGVVPNIIFGLATGHFSIPEGMTCAQLADFNPVYGLYSGVVAAVPNSDGSKASQSRDFLGEGLGNLSGGFLILADVDPAVEKELQTSGALDIIGAYNNFPATSRVLDAEITAWEAAQKLLQQKPVEDMGIETQSVKR